jgi:Glycosyltransferase Family 4
VGAPLLVVTPWYPVRAIGSPLDAAVAAAVDAAVRAGADVTVVHLVPRHEPDDAGLGGVPVRRVVLEGGVPPGDPAAVDAVAAALADGAADLLGAAAVVHAHGAVPVAAGVVRVLPEGARLVVGEHLPSALPLLAAPVGDAPLTAAWQAVLARADVVLAPSEDLARKLARSRGPDGPTASETASRARFDVLPYAFPPILPVPGAAAADGALPATRWLLLGPAAAAETVVRALAADALAGAPTTLTVAAPDDEVAAGLAALAARFGVERRLVPVAAEDLAGCAVDLVVGLDPLAAADPVLTAALGAGVPAVLARGAGSEDLVDEVAATGAVRLVPPGAGVVALLEAVADLRRGDPPRGNLLAPWRTSPDSVGRLLARHYGETVAAALPSGTARAWPRVLLVDLGGQHRNEIGRVARWLAGIGGEPVVVTAGAPPPSAGVAGAVSVDLRTVERNLTRTPLQGVRRRLPGVGRPAFDGALVAYRMLRRLPTLVDAALAGPLAPGRGPSPDVDAVVAADDAGAELARRWTGATTVLPPDTDRLIAHLTAARAGSVAGSATAS